MAAINSQLHNALEHLDKCRCTLQLARGSLVHFHKFDSKFTPDWGFIEVAIKQYCSGEGVKCWLEEGNPLRGNNVVFYLGACKSIWLLFVYIKMSIVVIAWRNARAAYTYADWCADISWPAVFFLSGWTAAAVCVLGVALTVNMIWAEDLLLMLMISVTGVDLKAQLLLLPLTSSAKHTHTHIS